MHSKGLRLDRVREASNDLTFTVQPMTALENAEG